MERQRTRIEGFDSLISFDDVVALSAVHPAGILIRTKCFLCKKDLANDDRVMQLARMCREKSKFSPIAPSFTFDLFKNKMNGKVILMHISCFADAAGDEFLFDES